jgi:predicted phage terminase large subunit-like protein
MVLRIVAPYNFLIYNMYLELEEDKTSETKGFYHHRKHHMGEMFTAFDDMESKDLYDILVITMPPRCGKTTTGIRFLSWIIGKYPEHTQLAVSYSDSITSSFYMGVIEIVDSQAFRDVFPDSSVVNQNAKKEEIWLKVKKRYPSITFVPIGGSMTGRAEAGKYLYCDDLVSGIEEALSITRLEKLVQTYNVNCKQRKKDGCKEIHVATAWSVHDVISNVIRNNENNPRCKVIAIPCYDEDGESQFNFMGGFSTEYYHDIENSMDDASFSALYKCEPIEREGLLYHKEDLQYYFDLPEEGLNSIVAICDSKNMGKDFVSAPIGYVYGDTVYIEDVTYSDALPDITRPMVAGKWVEHKVVRADVEVNNGGNYYAEDLNELIQTKGGKTSIRTFFSSNNKQVKIITYADYVVKHFVFKHPSTYSPNSQYGQFMKDMLKWTQMGNNKHDDSVDSIAMLAQLVQSLTDGQIKFLDRRKLGI